MDTLRFTDECLRLTFQEYRQSIIEAQERMKRLEKEISNQAQTGHQAPLVQVLQGLRGIGELTAVTMASEIGNIGSRFLHPKFLMSYSGLVPSENSSGDRRWQGGITKAGNSHIRRVLTEAAWSYRYSPAVRLTMRRRLNGLSPAIQAISWKAQNRLHKKYKTMLHRNKHKGAIAAAIARELAGFVWAIATEFEKEKARSSFSS
ncbi:transposase [Paenibacillus filicis]|uniref:Transposase n=1 Tax=Paenibacillus gyeongsangnamensis TaxID=3388067 RepID=A0ABT4QKV7_9BACL|nr:transposase [Paenibacillus filicis]MCZ8517496.1 transposase [Paenibacillus filicis]